MKKLVIVAIAIMIAGCSMSPEKIKQYQSNKNFETTKIKTSSGKLLSVKDLREMYKKETGLILPQQETISCSLNASCYYDKYANAYEDLISDYRGREYAKKYEQEKREKERCEADKECSRVKRLSYLNAHLKQIYFYLINSNPYMKSDFDMAFRNLCENAANEEKAGVSSELVINRIKDKPGIDPDTRMQAVDAASTCWEISNKGGNWKEALR